MQGVDEFSNDNDKDVSPPESGGVGHQ